MFDVVYSDGRVVTFNIFVDAARCAYIVCTYFEKSADIVNKETGEVMKAYKTV